ncbi:MAG TPA: pitrilysin family protein [Candidatus Hydrogenedentes bacterium]|nr:pitrilysin family protein [Candidatus Hydrogenedentota bacterium]HQM47214.1 pitrilysin family protein [Candidatus Hydrogenedentota bacterium]
MAQTSLPRAEGGQQTRSLANGVTLLTERLPYVRSVSLGVWIKTGSACELPHLTGISHFLEHLFFKGTSTRTTRQLMEAIESRGGHLNAYTSRDYTCVYAKTLDTHLATAAEILGDIICDSQFFDFEKERNVVLEEIASNEDVPEDYIHDLFVSDLFPKHSLGAPVSGTHKSVSGITLEDVRAHYARWYHPQNMVISVAGNLDADEALDLIEKAFAPLKPGNTPVVPAYDAPTFGTGIDACRRKIAQSHYCIGFPGPATDDPVRFVYDILGNALGGGSTSRLFERIREQEGLSYAIYTFQSAYYRAGLLGVYAAVAPENLDRALSMTFEEIRRIRDERISSEEVGLNREQLKGSLLMALEDTFHRMSRMAKSYMYHGRVVPLEEVIAKIDAVTSEEVHELANAILQAQSCMLTVLGPKNALHLKEIPL